MDAIRDEIILTRADLAWWEFNVLAVCKNSKFL